MELFLCVVTHPFLWIFIGLVGVAYAIQWLVSQRFVSQKVTHFDITGLIQTSFGLNHVPKYVIRLVWYLWIILFLAMLFSILFAHYNIILMISRPDTKLESLSVSAYALPAMVVPLSALIAFPITVLRQHYNRRQTEAEEEGLITDRINAAVASLGADKIVKDILGEETTKPNVEVRVGAILALERLAQKNDNVHVQIMEILCSYLRENTKQKVTVVRGGTETIREDVQMALTIIGRRNKKQIDIEEDIHFRIDLQDCHLEYAVLSDALFDEAILNRSKLNHADFRFARLNNAEMKSTELKYAKFNDAEMNHAELDGAFLNNAVLNGAVMHGASLEGSELIDAQLCSTELIGATLNNANLFRAVLNRTIVSNKTDFREAEFDDVQISCMDFVEANISDGQLNEMFGDETVILASHTRPMHWPDMILDWIDFDTEYKKWVDDPEGYKFDRSLYEPDTD